MAERRGTVAPMRRLALASLAAIGPGLAYAQQPLLLDPERAFAFSVQALDERTVEARFSIADGYYLYRDKLRFAVEPGALAPVDLPPGEVHEDEYFGKVAIYRHEVAVRLPLAAAAPRSRLTVTAQSQGCADAGVCYLPQTQRVSVTLPAAGAPPGPAVSAAPAKKSWLD